MRTRRGSKRKLFVILVAICGVAIALFATLLWPPRCPIALKVVMVEPTGLVDHSAFVTLSISNTDCVAIRVNQDGNYDAKVEDRWVSVNQPMIHDWIAAGLGTKKDFIVPGGSKVLRLRINFESETWKTRLMVRLGPAGRNWVAKSPALRKLVWPDQYNSMPATPSWKEITLEVPIPEIRPAAQDGATNTLLRLPPQL